MMEKIDARAGKMTPKNTTALKNHLQAIAAILYEETTPENLNTLEEIEQTVRQKVLKHVSPEIGVFLSKQLQVQPKAEQDD